jgi:hypothetical protein
VARQKITHGGFIDTPTSEEMRAMMGTINQGPERAPSRVRATAIIVLDATGAGQDEVYTVPAGYEFALRRVTLDLDTASDPSTGNVLLNVAGRAVEYLRSGARIEYAAPLSPNSVAQVPGVQTWANQQGPYLRNSEVFEVKVRGLTALSRLSVIAEGILQKREARGSE